MVTKEEILQKKSIIMEVKIAGMKQKHEFVVERFDTAVGNIPFLVCKRALPLSEIMRVAEETGLPVNSLGQKVYPTGKSPKDFIDL